MVLTDSTISVLKRGTLSNNWCKLIVICKTVLPENCEKFVSILLWTVVAENY